MYFSLLSLLGTNVQLGDEILGSPSHTLSLFDTALCRAQKVMLDGMAAHDKTDLVVISAVLPSYRTHQFIILFPCSSFHRCVCMYIVIQELKPHVHARITGLPVCPELVRDTLPRTSDIGSFLSITGTDYFDQISAL